MRWQAEKSDLPKIHKITNKDLQTIDLTDPVNGYLWLNTLHSTKTQDVIFEAHVDNENPIGDRCVVKMVAAKDGMDALYRALKLSDDDRDFPKVIVETEIGDHVSKKLRVKAGKSYKIGFIATCEMGETNALKVSARVNGTEMKLQRLSGQ